MNNIKSRVGYNVTHIKRLYQDIEQFDDDGPFREDDDDDAVVDAVCSRRCGK